MHAHKLFIFACFAMCTLASAHLGKALINMLKGVEDEDPDPELAMKLVKSKLLAEKHLREKVSGATALHVALSLGYEEIALELIKISTDVNMKNDYYGDTPLHVAANVNLKTCVKELIKRGASLESKNKSDSTPLFHAILDTKNFAYADVVKVLLDAGANPHAKGRYFTSKLLHYASRCANAPVMELLMSRGVDVNEFHIDWKGDIMRPLDDVMLEIGPKQKTAVIVCLNNGAEQTDKNPFESVLKKFWKTGRDEIFEGLDDYVLRNIEENFTRDNMEADEDVPPPPKSNAKRSFLSITTEICSVSPNMKRNIWDLVKKFDEEGMFALYRILKWRYVKILRGKRQSNFERKIFDISDHLFTRMLEKTYLGIIPLEIAADAFSSFPLYYRWKVDRFAFNFALAAHYLKLNVQEAKDAALEFFSNIEAEGANTFSYEEQLNLRKN